MIAICAVRNAQIGWRFVRILVACNTAPRARLTQALRHQIRLTVLGNVIAHTNANAQGIFYKKRENCHVKHSFAFGQLFMFILIMQFSVAVLTAIAAFVVRVHFGGLLDFGRGLGGRFRGAGRFWPQRCRLCRGQ